MWATKYKQMTIILYYIGFNKVFTSTNDKDLLGLSSIRLSEKNDDAFCCTEYNEYLIVTE